MPDTKVTLYNRETGALEALDLGAVDSALKSGRYLQPEGGAEAYTSVAGTNVPRSATEAAREAESGAVTSSGAVEAASRREREIRESYRTTEDAALTFIEGVADAASFGVVRDRSEMADVRRGEHGAAQFLGELVGTLTPGPGVVMHAGREAGALAARTLLKEVKAGSRAGVLVKGAEGAAEGAALMGAQSFGSQLADAVLDDKPFTGEAVLHELKTGAAFGFGLGLVGGAAERALSKATRREVARSGGLADPASAVSSRVHSEVDSGLRGMHDMLAEHEGRLGVAEVLGREGAVPQRLVTEHRELVGAARRAKAKLESLDARAALSGDDPRAYARWRDAMEDYQEKLVAVDERLVPHLREASGRQAFRDLPVVDLGSPRERLPIERPVDEMAGIRAGHVDRDAFALDDRMTPELRAEYERIYGEKFQSLDEALDELAPLRDVPPEENPGGVVSETSEKGTRAGKRKAGGEQAKEVVENVVQEELTPSAPVTGERGPSTTPGRVLRPKAEPGNRLNEAYSSEELVLRDDGWFQRPPVGAEENAQLFNRFQDKMAVDTRARAEARAARRAPATEPGVHPDVAELRTPTRPLRPAEGAPEPGTRAGKRPAKSAPIAPEPVPAEPAPAPRSTPPESPAAKRPGGRRAVREYVDRWYAQARGPVVTPADRAAARMRDVVESIRNETGGALDAAGSIDLLRAQKLNPARSSFGTTLDQVYSARQLARAVADASRGRANAASKAGRSWLLKWVGERVGGRVGSQLGRRALGSALGGVVGGPAGYVLGAAFADRVLGFTGRAAGAAGRLNEKVMSAAAGLMSSKVPIRTAAAVSASRAPTYLPGEDPVDDPVKRSLHVRELAANPDAYRARLREALGDLPVLHPDVIEPAIDAQVRNVVQLSLRAPRIYWSQLGVPSAAGSQDVRRWRELEAAAHDVRATLDAVGRGAATDAQIEGLRVFHPEAFSRLTAALVADPDKLASRTREQLRHISRVVGVPLTPGDDPGFVARQQQAWQTHAAPAPNGLNAPPPTPSQAGSRQPGNPGVTPTPSQR